MTRTPGAAERLRRAPAGRPRGAPGPARRLPGALAGLAVALVVAACGSTGPSAASSGSSAGAPIRVIATTTIFADIVRNVGGSCVSVDSIVPPGVGPEDYEPRPDDARRIADAQLIVSNGVGLDNFLDKLLAANSSSAPRLVLGDGIPTIDVGGRPNPHFWLDPALVRTYYVPAIETKLESLAPACAPTIRAGAAAYTKQLADLDAELLARVATIPAANRTLVTAHDAFPYFARHFGFQVIGVIVANVGQEPSAADLATLVNTIKSAGVRAIFSEAQFSPKLAQTLAAEAGVQTVVSDLLTDALGPNGETYLSLMRWDVNRVVSALTGGI